MRLLHSAFVLAALGACAQQPDTGRTMSALEDERFTIDVADERALGGTFETSFGIARFETTRISETEIKASLLVGATPIDLYATRTDDVAHVGFRVLGGELDEAAHALLAGLHGELANLAPYPEEGSFDPAAPHVQLLRDYAGILSEAPSKIGDELHDTKVSREDMVESDPDRQVPKLPPPPPPPPACGDVPDQDGVRPINACCRGGTPMAWQHDAIPTHCFTTTLNWCGIGAAVASGPTGGFGDAQCPGRCGPGCAAIPGYTQDCLDYDYCVAHDGLDRCSDEWTETIDDAAYTWAVGSAWAPIAQLLCP